VCVRVCVCVCVCVCVRACVHACMCVRVRVCYRRYGGKILFLPAYLQCIQLSIHLAILSPPIDQLRCIKDWMNTKNTFHTISLERKMIWVSDVITDLFLTGQTHCPTQSHAHMLYFRLSLPCVPRFSEGVADLQKERTCKRYIDERTTAHAATNGRSEDWQCNNTE